jgi:hypothetical protein
MGQHIEPADVLIRKSIEVSRVRSADLRRSMEVHAHRKTLDQIILDADGFAQVYPEHKYEIVKRLQEQKYVVGMTGDGIFLSFYLSIYLSIYYTFFHILLYFLLWMYLYI